MPWLCLEKCGDNSTKIQNDLKNIKQNSNDLTGVSFELYHLGPNSAFVNDHLTPVTSFLQNLGLETYPMIDSCIWNTTVNQCIYPQNFLDWMRQVFAQPNGFIQAAVQDAVTYGYTGYNVDWEPTEDGNSQDAVNYCAFLELFATKLHGVGKKLNVDIASWNPIWNWTAISQSSVDGIFLMSTYAGNFETFQHFLKKAITEIDMNKLGIGLETVNEDNNDLPFTPDELAERFNLVISTGVKEIDIWRTSIPDNWWPFIRAFLS